MTGVSLVYFAVGISLSCLAINASASLSFPTIVKPFLPILTPASFNLIEFLISLAVLPPNPLSSKKGDNFSGIVVTGNLALYGINVDVKFGL